MAENEI